MLGTDLSPEFIQGVDGGIDFPSQPLLSASKRRHNVLERRVADNKQVDVACGAEFATGCRTEDERQAYPPAEWRKRLAEQIRQPCRLGEQALELREDRGLTIGLEVDLPALNGSVQKPGSGQLLQFPLSSAERRAAIADDLAEIEGFVGVAEQPAENPTARAAEQHCRGIGGPGRNCGGCSHNAYKRTQNRNTGQPAAPCSPDQGHTRCHQARWHVFPSRARS